MIARKRKSKPAWERVGAIWTYGDNGGFVSPADHGRWWVVIGDKAHYVNGLRAAKRHVERSWGGK